MGGSAKGVVRRPLVGLLVTVSMLTVAYGSGPGNSTAAGGEDATTSAPTPEDALVFAGPGGAIGEVYQEALDEFSAEHGVEITYVEGTGTSGFARVQAEAQADRREIDMLQSNDQILALGAGQDIWEPLDMDLMTNAEHVVQDLAFPEDVVGDPPVGVRLIVNTVGLAYNTEIFEQNGWDPPTSWEDLYDPQYAECVIPLGPESNLPYLPMLNQLNSGDYGDLSTTLERFEAIRDQVPVWSDSNPEALELLAQEVGCLTPTSQGRAVEAIANGAPLAFVNPEEGTPFFGGAMSIVRDAPHPVAAQMFLNVMLSREFGQRLLDESGFATVNAEVEPSASGPGAEIPVASEVESLDLVHIPLSAFDNVDAWIQEWTQLASG